MPTYVFGSNVLGCCVATWSAIIYALLTRDWVGTALWLTLAFALVSAPALTPKREEPEAE